MPARCISACQKPRSNEALCATSGQPAVKRASSAITSADGGALASISLLMPVRAWMCGGTQAPLFIRLLQASTTSPWRTSTAATSVARPPLVGPSPVVSKSTTATVSIKTSSVGGA
jgi:hypothetical protein